MELQTILETINAEWNMAFNAGNAEAVAALYAESAVLSPGDGNLLTGRSEIQGLFNSFIEAGVHNHTLEILETGGSESVIYQVAKWSAQGAEEAGHKPSFGGITTNVLRKDVAGRWLTSSHIWNTNQ